MNILQAKEFEKRKIDFFREHGLADVDTSPMEFDGTYRKLYNCEDGHQWIEVMRPVYKPIKAEVCKVTIEGTVKMLETEAWSTEDSASVYYYEAWQFGKVVIE